MAESLTTMTWSGWEARTSRVKVTPSTSYLAVKSGPLQVQLAVVGRVALVPCETSSLQVADRLKHRAVQLRRQSCSD